MPSFATDVPALLLRLDPNPYHHGTLGAARSLGRAGVEVHALLGTDPGPVARTRYLHRLHTPVRWSAAGAAGTPPDGELERALLGAARAIGRPAVLVPLDDHGAIAVARLAPRLAGHCLLPSVAPRLPAQLADKAELAALCDRAGVPHPRTVLPGSAAEAAREAAALGLPVVAKWSRPWLLPPGLRSTALVRTPGEAARLFARSAEAGSALLLQRRLPDGPGADWFFHGYAAEGGRLLACGAGRKERSWPPHTGLTAVGTWLPNPAVEAAAARLTARLDYRGILDLDFRLDPHTGVHHLVDFNPRPGAQFRLFTDENGVDVVRAQHLHLTGRPVPAARASPGRTYVVENYAVLSALLGRTQDASFGRTGRVRRARGPVERAWFAADDPLPFAAMAAGWLARCLREGLRLGRPRLGPRHRRKQRLRGLRARRAVVPRPAASAAPPARAARAAPAPPAAPAPSHRPSPAPDPGFLAADS